MLKSLKIIYSRRDGVLFKSIHKNNNNLFKILNKIKFSSSHNHENNHAGNHEDHNQDYHKLKFDRVSYNQILNKEQRKPYYLS